MIPRRVAYVVSTFPKISETFIAGELAALLEEGVDVRVLSLTRPEDALAHDIVRTSGMIERTTYGAHSFAAVLAAFEPDLVHAHFATDPTATARTLAAGRGVPFTFTAHGYDVYRRPPADFAARAAAASGVVTVSDANRRYIRETFGVPTDLIHVIPCGVDTDFFTPGDGCAEPPLIVCVARLRDVKQLDVLLRACALVRQRGVTFRCAIVGEGPERPALEALRARLGVEDVVEMPGAAEQNDIRAWWQRASIATLSSRSEGMPVSLMEAAACGVPAVAPAVGGIAELIDDGVTGRVTRPHDAHALAEGLIELLVDAPLRTRMRIAARARAERHFSRAHQISRLLQLWSAILN